MRWPSGSSKGRWLLQSIHGHARGLSLPPLPRCASFSRKYHLQGHQKAASAPRTEQATGETETHRCTVGFIACEFVTFDLGYRFLWLILSTFVYLYTCIVKITATVQPADVQVCYTFIRLLKLFKRACVRTISCKLIILVCVINAVKQRKHCLNLKFFFFFNLSSFINF